ncbi:MAG: ABC transporter permease [Clostridia bacterium]|nr:ABC transporter permease [Clostridia bacterium]
MTRYLINRLIRGFFSIIAVVAIIMILVYSALNRDLIFAADPMFSRLAGNNKTIYKYQRWEEYGYIDYVPYADWLTELIKNGEITSEKATEVGSFGSDVNGKDDTPAVKEYVDKFYAYYQSNGYTIKRLKASNKNGYQQLFAYKDIPIFTRMWNFFSKVISIDNIHYAEEVTGERGITFTLFDPVYGGNVFSPAIIGNGTKYKYLLYFDNKFPFIHQNLITINLGKAYTEQKGVDVWNKMTNIQGNQEKTNVIYPTGLEELSADNLHSATYVKGSLNSNPIYLDRYTDDYTNVSLNKDGLSAMGYSFLIGILSVVLAYLLGIPLGIFMARHKDGVIDKIGTFYIIFIIAVPSLAYIFIFRAIGGAFGLPITFDTTAIKTTMYILPIVSLALPSVAGLMKWLRRYMIDQSNADYVKFARSEGLSENEIFRKHILKNAAIPIIHGIPGAILGSLVGALITESVYVVPGTGRLLTEAISTYDNAVIVGVAMFYAVLSVVSIILGDVLMAMIDPRISFSSKGR